MIGRYFSLIMANWQIAAGVVALLIGTHTLAYCEGRSDGSEAVEARYAAARVEALKQAREADAEATETADGVRTGIEEGNDRAKEASRNSDDPLRSALDSLR